MIICIFPDGQDGHEPLSGVLRSLGYEVRVAALPTEPLVASAEAAVVQLPPSHSDSVALVQLWRSALPAGHPILALGSWPEARDVEPLIQSGASDYLTYPCETRDLAIRLLVLRGAASQFVHHSHPRIASAQRVESLTTLAGALAHDFNNLLAAILGNAEVAMLDPSLSEPTRRSLAQIDHASRHAAELTRQMMTYAGRPSPGFVPVCLQSLVEDMAGILRASISRRCRVEFCFDPGLPPVPGEACQLRQVVMNLLINASEAMTPGGGVIHVAGRRASRQDQPRVILEVSDSGVGIPHEHQQRIFEPYFSTKRSGRGLGLAAVRSIVRAHSGEISIDSQPGIGSTFRLDFPAGVSAGQAHVTGRALAARGVSKAILLVDAGETVRQAAAHLLTRSGFQVLQASSGEEGAVLFRRHASALNAVILDLECRDSGSGSLLRAIREIRPGLQILIWSAFGEPEIRSRTKGFDIAAVLRKPCPVRELAVTLNRVLSNPPGAVA